MAELQADFELLPRETLEAEMSLEPRSEVDATFQINIATKGDKGDKGDTGPAGKDATINGQNTITLNGSDGISVIQNGETTTISGSALMSLINGLATVAKTGSYTDLINQPTIGNATLTIQRNGASAGTFTANATQNKTINIQVPTNASDVGALPSTTTINDLTSQTQQQALNSGINTTLVGQITSNKNAISSETTNRQNADNDLQQQIDAISASSDVTDIVGTYAELQAYDTTKLKDNDIIKVLQDETEGGATTYYRWSTHTHTFTLIGEEGPYYTKSQADEEFVPQTRTVNGKALSSNITLDASDVNALPSSTVIPTVNNATLTVTLNGVSVGTFTANSSTDVTIPVTDTTYSAFVGTDGEEDGAAGLVPAPTSYDYSYVLRGDGSWGSVDYYELTNRPTIPTSADYWTITTDQTSSGKKMINYTQSGAQDNGFRVISKSDSSSVGTVGAWTARVLIGNEKRTFLLGTARNSSSTSQSICGIGAHTWGSATSQTSAQWDNVYFQPDGSTGTYLGGNGWRGSSGWFRVLNNNSGNAGYRTTINTGTAASPTWRTVLPNQASGTGAIQFNNNVSATFSYNYSTSVGGTTTANYGSSFGYGSSAAGYALALGYSAIASGNYSIQVGYGTNSTANTMYVGLSSSLNVQLLDSAGKIPDARLNSTIARTSDVTKVTIRRFS